MVDGKIKQRNSDLENIRKFKFLSLEVQWEINDNSVIGTWSLGSNKKLVGSWVYIRGNNA